MAWRYPKRRIVPGSVLDVQDFNDALRPLVEETGRLEEQNLSDDLGTELTLATDCDTDVAWRYAHAFASDEETLADANAQLDPTVSSNEMRVYQSFDWQPITDLDATFRTEDFAPYYICASGAYALDSSASAGSVHAYFRFALEIDGRVIPETIIGDQDSNHENENMELGMSGQFGGFLVESVVPLAPGVHTIRAVVQVKYVLGSVMTNDVDIYNRELFVWELGR